MESQSYSPKCITKKKYLQYYDKPMDLFVLVYDTNLERDIRPKNNSKILLPKGTHTLGKGVIKGKYPILVKFEPT